MCLSFHVFFSCLFGGLNFIFLMPVTQFRVYPTYSPPHALPFSTLLLPHFRFFSLFPRILICSFFFFGFLFPCFLYFVLGGVLCVCVRVHLCVCVCVCVLCQISILQLQNRPVKYRLQVWRFAIEILGGFVRQWNSRRVQHAGFSGWTTLVLWPGCWRVYTLLGVLDLQLGYDDFLTMGENSLQC